MNSISFTTCGNRRYFSKPDKLPSEMRYFKSYTGRTINIEAREMDVKAFAEYVITGHAFYPCVLSDKGGVFKTVNRQCFEYANIIAFDLEKGNHSEIKVRDTLINAGLLPAFLYRTYSHRQNGNGDRNRVVYRLPYTVKNPAEYLLMGVLFWAIYEDIDTTCLDTARLFYGTVNPTCYINEEAVLNIEMFVDMALKAIQKHKENHTPLYEKLIAKLTETAINCQIENGLPVVCCEGGRLVFRENLTAKQARLHRESANAAIDDAAINSNKDLPRITIINWYEKAMIEPLFRELVNGSGDFGYRKAVVIASNYRFIDADDVKDVFFGLLRDNAPRFSDINHTIEECRKIWEMPTAAANGGFGSRPLPYRYCGELPQDEYDYPLSFIRNMRRTLDLQRQKRVSEDLEEIFANIDFEANPHGFLINGGVGLGKTYSFLNDDEAAEEEQKAFSIKRALDKRYNKTLKMVFLCSRQGARIQNVEKYKSTTDGIYYVADDEDTLPHIDANKIVCITYHKFMSLLDDGIINENTFDIIVADECHSLFDDSFASQMGAFLAWVLDYKGKVIWITANASYFQRCFDKFVEMSNAAKTDIRKLYEDEGQHLIMRYDTNKVIYSTTSNINYFIVPQMMEVSPQYRVLVYLKSATDCYNFYRAAIKRGLRAGFYVSAYCDTELKATDDIDDDVRAYLEEHGLEAMPMREVFELKEDKRSQQNSERLKDALLKGENFPDDIDIIFTTDALRESININPESNVKVIITDDYHEVGVLQKRGRVRADIDAYFIIPNRRGTERGLLSQIETFEGKGEKRGVLDMTQQELAEEYGKQKQRERLHKGGTAYVLRFGNPSTDEAIYMPNRAGYVGLKAKLEEFKQIHPPDKEHNKIAAEKYSAMTSTGRVNIVYELPVRRLFIDVGVVLIAQKYAGLPLIGETAQRLIEECGEFLRRTDKSPDFALNLIIKEMRAAGFEVKRGKVGKKHIKGDITPDLLGRNAYFIQPKK